MTIKTPVLATALLTLTLALLGAAHGSPRLAPVASTVATYVDTARVAAHIDSCVQRVTPVQTACIDPTLVAAAGTR
ncbi:MAG TPA: hypothetical protein VMI54_20000 [Polyangiaceae bacterium]|nr:hypothetical protein [Polyangiaceae bacterium]